MKFAAVFLIFVIFVTLRETTAETQKSFWARLFDLDLDEESLLLERARTVLARVVLEIPQSQIIEVPTNTTTTEIATAEAELSPVYENQENGIDSDVGDKDESDESDFSTPA